MIFSKNKLPINEKKKRKKVKNLTELYDENTTLGDRISDKLAAFAGSWTFIICFSLVLIFWVIINSVRWVFKPFDPYPFILMNLVLSCLAAFQAPVIMMSQNRQEEKDRIRAQHDYEVNERAESLIEDITKRLDRLEGTHKIILKNQEKILKNIEKDRVLTYIKVDDIEEDLNYEEEVEE